MNEIQGNLLDQTPGILCHQVNCRGIMGAGVALQIRQKWSSAYDDYMRHCHKGAALGDVVFSKVGGGVLIAHLFGQHGVGSDSCQTDYNFYPVMLEEVQQRNLELDLPVYLPHGIGCGLAGGDWEIMYPILKENLPEATLVRFQP